MRVLFVIRLHSGLSLSIASGKWAPRGAPAIYKLIEGMAARAQDLRIVFTSVASDALAAIGERTNVEVEGTAIPVTLLQDEAARPRWLGKFRYYVHEASQFLALRRIARHYRPDVIYVDRGNLPAAGLLARYSGVPVVFRVMGISPGLRQIATGMRPRKGFLRWLLRSPFAAVICSQDGSGGESWLPSVLADGVPFYVVSNGVDLSGEEPGTRPGRPRAGERTVVLFVARLEAIKGCEEFVAGFLAAHAASPQAFHAVIVGSGGLTDSLRRMVADGGAEEAVTFTGEIAHSDILAQYRGADIYVSLNKMGNLSNTNLEAMRSGCCVIMPGAQPDLGIDVVTERLLPPATTAYRIPKADDVTALADALLHLHRHADERKARAQSTASLTEALIPSWAKRIDAEINLLEAVAAGARPPATLC